MGFDLHLDKFLSGFLFINSTKRCLTVTPLKYTVQNSDFPDKNCSISLVSFGIWLWIVDKSLTTLTRRSTLVKKGRVVYYTYMWPLVSKSTIFSQPRPNWNLEARWEKHPLPPSKKCVFKMLLLQIRVCEEWTSSDFLILPPSGNNMTQFSMKMRRNLT